MNVFSREVLAQVMFWGGMGCFPLAVGLFVMAFSKHNLLRSLTLFALGGLALTHFAWYFKYLGEALATKTGEFHPTPWPQFLPIGIVVAMGLACLKLYMHYKIANRGRRHLMP